MKPSVRVDVGLIESCVNKYTSTNNSTVTCVVGALIGSVFLRDTSAVRDDNEMLIKCVIFSGHWQLLCASYAGLSGNDFWEFGDRSGNV